MRRRSLRGCKAVHDAVLNVELLNSSREDVPLECQHVLVESYSETAVLSLLDFNTDGFSEDEDEQTLQILSRGCGGCQLLTSYLLCLDVPGVKLVSNVSIGKRNKATCYASYRRHYHYPRRPFNRHIAVGVPILVAERTAKPAGVPGELRWEGLQTMSRRTSER